jgi:hypothetical protein
MAITRLKPTGVNNSASFTFSSITSTGVVTATGGGVKVGNIQDPSGTNTISLESGAVTLAGNLTIGTSGTGNFSATNANLGSILVSGLTSIQQATETIQTKTGATGTVTHDFTTGSVFFHTSMSADFTANFTNMPTTADKVIVIGLFLIQGSTPYRATAIQIDGVAQTINWPNATVPTATANRKEVQSFTFVYTGGSWYVFGNLTSFG